MRIEYIKRGAATRLILIFAGWSTDARYYGECVKKGWDTAVIHDYRDLTMPEIPAQYATVYLFAYSLGVWAAAASDIKAAVKVAVFGTECPVSDRFGIPDKVFAGTAESLTPQSLKKFHLRMAGDRETFAHICSSLPENPDIETLREELLAIADMAKSADVEKTKWDRAYVAGSDRIFPTQNQINYWKGNTYTEICVIPSPHAADMRAIISSIIPDTSSIGEGFAKALPTYRQHAVAQREICEKIGNMIKADSQGDLIRCGSLLEIGPGQGLLTDEWALAIAPESATYVDLYAMPRYGKTADERYVVADAELWIEDTDETFDYILSASAIQWFADPVRFVAEVRKHLNPGGTAILSTFVKGNLEELDKFRPSPIVYRDAEEYAAIPGAETLCWSKVVEFGSQREMLMHLKNTGVQPTERQNCLRERGCVVALSSYPTRLTYRPMIIKITKT